MQLVRIRHKGLRQPYEDGTPRGVPPAMADKLRKLLFAFETAETMEQPGRFPGWKLHPRQILRLMHDGAFFDRRGALGRIRCYVHA